MNKSIIDEQGYIAKEANYSLRLLYGTHKIEVIQNGRIVGTLSTLIDEDTKQRMLGTIDKDGQVEYIDVSYLF